MNKTKDIITFTAFLLATIAAILTKYEVFNFGTVKTKQSIPLVHENSAITWNISSGLTEEPFQPELDHQNSSKTLQAIIEKIPLGSPGAEYAILVARGEQHYWCKVKWDQQGCDTDNILPPDLKGEVPAQNPRYRSFMDQAIDPIRWGTTEAIPYKILMVPAHTQLEYCRGKVIEVSRRGDAEWNLVHWLPHSLGLRLKAWGSSNVFDRWGSAVEVKLTDVTYITAPNSPEQRQEAGCDIKFFRGTSNGENTSRSCVSMPGGGPGTMMCSNDRWEDGVWKKGMPYPCGICYEQ